MKRAAWIVIFLIVAAVSTAFGHRLGYQEALSVAGARARQTAAPTLQSTAEVAPTTESIPLPPGQPQQLPAVAPPPATSVAPAAPASERKPGMTLKLVGGELNHLDFSLGGGDPAATGDRARYPGIAILESEVGVTESQVLRMFEWLKMRDEAYSQLAQVKDPAVHAAQGQWIKDYYENLFRNEMTIEQQKKFDELKANGSFSFRGPPAFEK